MSEHALGNAGYAVTGSGGGGQDGTYVFASLEELDAILQEWTAIRDAIHADGEEMTQARFVHLRPADDEMSARQSSAVLSSFSEAEAHNRAMLTYADSYITKLRAAKEQYVSDDATAAARLDRIDEP